MFSNPRKKVTSNLGLIIVEDNGTSDLVLFDGKKLEKYLSRKKAPTETEFGQDAMRIIVGMMTLDKSLLCRGALEVQASAARKGYGPMLYDSAMAFAAKHGSPGLIPDRSKVSEAASRLWRFSQTKRSDVQADRTGFFCPEHSDTGRPELDAVYSLKKPFPGYSKLIKQGRDSLKMAEKKLAIPKGDSLLLIDKLRGIFWNCYYHGACPTGVKGPAVSGAAGTPNPRRR